MKKLITLLSLVSMFSAHAAIHPDGYSPSAFIATSCHTAGSILESTTCLGVLTTSSLPTMIIHETESIQSEESIEEALVQELNKTETPQTALVAAEIGADIEPVQVAVKKLSDAGEDVTVEAIEANL